MNNFNKSVLEAIGNTPIVRLKNIATHLKSEIYLKLEYLNPGGSIKDRIGKYIIEQAIKRGALKPGGTIVEGTSGNTGVGLAMYAAVYGYKAIFVLPDKQSQEKINSLRAFGAKVIVTPTNVSPDDPRSYYSVAKRIAETTPNAFYANQYYNLDNTNTHYHETGPEIYEQTGGEFDVFIAGVGTGGTISGAGKYLKEKIPDLKVVGVDIEGSILAHYHKTGEMTEAKSYVLEGIGEDIIPGTLNFDVIDDFVTVRDKECFLMTRALLTKEAIYAGGSSGAAVVGAIRYAEKIEKPKRILVIMPDSGNRYASKIFNDDWMRDNGYQDSSFNVQVSEVLNQLKKGSEPLITIYDNSTIGDAIKIMQDNDISQLPVYNNEYLVGIVSENRILRPLFEGKISTGDAISVAIDNNLKIVDPNDLLERVTSSLLEKRTVLVCSENKAIAILTNIDILNFMAQAKEFNQEIIHNGK